MKRPLLKTKIGDVMLGKFEKYLQTMEFILVKNKC
jgi:hypothetical protein